MYRAWAANVLSVLTLARIDICMFNQESSRWIRELDYAYLAYINYVRMEHEFNNPVVNGFCEILIDSMLTTKAKRDEIEGLSKVENFNWNSKSTGKVIKKSNQNFKFESFLRLRNLVFLYSLLKLNPKLKEFRHKRINENDERIRDETFSRGIKRVYEDMKKFFKKKVKIIFYCKIKFLKKFNSLIFLV